MRFRPSAAPQSTFWFELMRELRWKLAAGLAAAAFMGLHFSVLLYGTIGQAYGFCLLLTVQRFAWRCGALIAQASNPHPSG